MDDKGWVGQGGNGKRIPAKTNHFKKHSWLPPWRGKSLEDLMQGQRPRGQPADILSTHQNTKNRMQAGNTAAGPE